MNKFDKSVKTAKNVNQGKIRILEVYKLCMKLHRILVFNGVR